MLAHLAPCILALASEPCWVNQFFLTVPCWARIQPIFSDSSDPIIRPHQWYLHLPQGSKLRIYQLAQTWSWNNTQQVAAQDFQILGHW
jgi:hypothetical protein